MERREEYYYRIVADVGEAVWNWIWQAHRL